MSLELTVLIAFIGLVTLSAIMGDSGPIAAFRNAGPSLGARVEIEMTTGRCFSVARGAPGACTSVTTWQ
jgi:hypothetical protein